MEWCRSNSAVTSVRRSRTASFPTPVGEGDTNDEDEEPQNGAPPPLVGNASFDLHQEEGSFSPFVSAMRGVVHDGTAVERHRGATAADAAITSFHSTAAVGMGVGVGRGGLACGPLRLLETGSDDGVECEEDGERRRVEVFVFFPARPLDVVPAASSRTAPPSRLSSSFSPFTGFLHR